MKYKTISLILTLAFAFSIQFAFSFAEEDYFQEVVSGVYAGQATVGKETVYFGMEKIDKENEKTWLDFSGYCKSLCRPGEAGILYNIANAISNDREVTTHEIFGERTGFTEGEFRSYVDKVRESLSKNKYIIPTIKSIPDAIGGFWLYENTDAHVIYASKVRVTGRYHFKDDAFASLKEFYNGCSNIIMAVSSFSNHNDTQIYENRGIFTNPISVIEDVSKYPGLSKKLHGFSAAVWKTMEKDRMQVFPIGAMRGILMKKELWSPGDCMIWKKDLLNLSEEEFDSCLNNKVAPTFIIKADALIHLFRN